jgi:hypothetical protein
MYLPKFFFLCFNALMPGMQGWVHRNALILTLKYYQPHNVSDAPLFAKVDCC